jgi:hypothetical protein
MRKALMVGFLCLSASATALAQLQALNVTTGSWDRRDRFAASRDASCAESIAAAQQEAMKQRFGGAPKQTLTRALSPKPIWTEPHSKIPNRNAIGPRTGQPAYGVARHARPAMAGERAQIST